MNWVTAVATTNQWTVIWLGVGLVVFLALYALDIDFNDPLNHGAGRGNPIPAFFVTVFGVVLLALLVMGIGYVVDWVIWMWNN